MSPNTLVTLRAAIATVIISAAAATNANATYFSTTPNPFPDGSGFDLNTSTGICVTATECTHDIFISNLQYASSGAVAAGYQEGLTASFTASFSNGATATLALVPGTFFNVIIGNNYNPFNNAIGTFTETLQSASFAGTDSLGNAITASLLTTPATTGSVSITSFTGGFKIDNEFTVNAQSTVNGSPVTVPPLTATNTAPPTVSAPEPASMTLLGVSLVGMLAGRRRTV